MKLTKFQHACFTLEKDGAVLVADPGDFTHDFIVPRHVDGIVITHEHGDHLSESLIQAILKENPKAIIIAHESIVGRFTTFSTIAAKPGESHVVGAFSLRFFGGEHAQIAPSVPAPANLSVLVDDRLYYPGDSFTVPGGVTVKELALPAAAPWMKISESMAFLKDVAPVFVFPTHDEILSADGKALADRMLGGVAAGLGATYRRIDGQSVELS